MDHIEFEKLLGKHISLTEKAIGNDFKNTLFSKNSYIIEDEFIKKEFYGMKYNHLYILFDGKDAVQSITVLFRKVIDRPFYDSFVGVFGKPDPIYVMDNIKVLSDDSYTDDGGNFVKGLKRSEGDLIEGSFEDKPVFIIWRKEGYEIKAFLRHEMNISEVAFKIFE